MPDEDQWAQKASKDVTKLEEVVRSMQSWKAGRRGDSPAEIWRKLLCDRKVQALRAKEVKEVHEESNTARAVEEVMKMSRRRGKVPAQWHWNAT